MDTIVAGESYSVTCNSGLDANVKVGDKLPAPNKAQVRVLEVDGAKVVVGPLRAGALNFGLPCSDGLQPVAFIVTEMTPEAAMNRYRPLKSEKIEYPDSIYFLILAILLTPVLIALAIIFRKKKILIKKTSAVKVKQSSRDLLENEVRFLESNVTLPESHHFHQLYKRLRKFIEKELNLKTRALTTQEFLGTFRALALQQSSNQNLIAQLEYLLRTADDVRFAGKAFTTDLWKDYLQKIRGIMAAFPKKVAEEAKKR